MLLRFTTYVSNQASAVRCMGGGRSSEIPEFQRNMREGAFLGSLCPGTQVKVVVDEPAAVRRLLVDQTSTAHGFSAADPWTLKTGRCAPSEQEAALKAVQ